MKNLQLFEALKTLNEKEFKEFGKFIHSPYYNNRSEVIRFYEALKKFHPDFSAKNINEEKIFNMVYPGKKFSNTLMRKIISLTILLYQKFIADLKFKQNELNYGLELLESLRKRKLLKIFNKNYKSYLNRLEKLQETMEIYEYSYKSEKERRLIYESTDSQIENNSSSLNKIYSYFFTVILNEHLNIANMESDYYKNIDIKFFDQIMEYISKSDYRKNLLINFYFLMIKLKTSPDNNIFHELTAFLNKYSDRLDKEHCYNALIVLIDYCLLNIGNGKREYREFMFELSNKLYHDDLMNKDSTEPVSFTNIVRNSAILKKFEWTEQFIDKYKENLHHQEKESIIKYCNGLIEFEKGNYAKSLKILSNINLKWINMKYDIKKTMLKCYYELGYFEELILQIDSYKHFINIKKNNTGRNHRGDRLLSRYITKLNECRNSKNKNSSENLRLEVEKSVYFYHKEWILEKLTEL